MAGHNPGKLISSETNHPEFGNNEEIRIRQRSSEQQKKTKEPQRGASEPACV